ncbi:MAG: hypothetical protein EHM17_00230 [Verrucomicrobiaceae bacterium]|nr:MAG: hypothetical protein EHM17_16845 [Verrucomicrobiaceae bacterium]RPJ31808.1 MAG: hypothetical protein EHM17_15025 [Verrucomicrobiaceae bacterium]RPJ33057.1 MAG: hypothetical protein EHM17_11595 [Verrucomicrobiaceae bacterium]RPJ36047.1 MAG: hypothetical protein EHM17_00230 [Verrucomicrobiaceae bacterium]
MPLDPSILAQGKPFQMPDPLQNYAKVLQIQNAQQQLKSSETQQQVSQMQLDEMRRDREEIQKIQQERIAQGQDPDLRKLASSMMNTKQYFKDGVELLQKLDQQDKLNAIMGGGATNALAPAPTAPSGMPTAPANALAKTALPAPGMLGGMPGGMPEAAPLGTPVRTAPARPVGATAAPIQGASVSTQAQETLGKINQLYALGTPQAVSIAKGLEAQMKFLESRVPLPADVEEQKARLARAGAPSVNVSTEKQYGQAFAGKVAESDAGMREAALKAPEMANTANRILELTSTGKVFTGTGANIKLQLAKALGMVGANDSQTAANTEALVADMGASTLAAIKTSGLGTGQGFTNKDLEFLQNIAGGRITLEKDTIQRIAELQHKAAEASAQKWAARVKQIPAATLEGTGITTEPVQVPKKFGTKAAPAAGGLKFLGYEK